MTETRILLATSLFFFLHRFTNNNNYSQELFKGLLHCLARSGAGNNKREAIQKG
jgi:hypothetical protein